MEIIGSNGSDILIGTADRDFIFGLSGDDQIRGGFGADYIDGGINIFGGDVDFALYDDSPVGVLVSLETGHGYGGTAQGDMLRNIEGLVGSDFSDALIGDFGSNVLWGEGGVDGLWGGRGNDDLIGGAGADYLDGGDGTDLASYIGSPDGVAVNLQEGSGSWGDAQGDTLVNIENVEGSSFDDSIVGNAANNTLFGATGGDTLEGRDGRDVLYGDDGNDLLIGGIGDDDLHGGPGHDWLEGDAGADRFIFESTQDSRPGLEADWIAGFNRAEGDLIDLAAIDADEKLAGDQAFTFVTAGEPHGPGTVSAVASGGWTYISLNTSGDEAPEAVIQILGEHAIDASWFIL